jgi:hypothetical protein
MYTKGDLVEDYTSGKIYTREILDPDGIVICHVIEDLSPWSDPCDTPADALLNHLNRT